jgi:hypothetical protein
MSSYGAHASWPSASSIVIAYGEWTRPRLRNFREQCCDCGLIHRLDFRIVDGQIEFRTRRDDRATAAARRRLRFARDG